MLYKIFALPSKKGSLVRNVSNNVMFTDWVDMPVKEDSNERYHLHIVYNRGVNAGESYVALNEQGVFVINKCENWDQAKSLNASFENNETQVIIASSDWDLNTHVITKNYQQKFARTYNQSGSVTITHVKLSEATLIGVIADTIRIPVGDPTNSAYVVYNLNDEGEYENYDNGDRITFKEVARSLSL